MKKNYYKKPLICVVALSLVAPTGWAAIPVTQLGYNAGGQLASTQTGSGAPTTYGYDAFGRVAQENWPSVAGLGTGTVQYGHASIGGVGAVKDPRDLVTSYVRNGFGEVTQQSSPDTGTDVLTYDEAGNLASRLLANGAQLGYQYDALNRLKRIDRGDSVSEFFYDGTPNGIGRLTSMQDGAGQLTQWDYDAAGNLVEKRQTAGGASALVVAYGWSGGRNTSVTYPSGKVVSYVYDQDRIVAVQVNGVTVLDQVTYQPFGPVSGWSMVGAGRYDRTYDTAGRITSYTGAGGQVSLNWDAANRLSSSQAAGWSPQAYGHDELDRLRSEAGPLANQSFGVDLSGNRVGGGLTIDPASNRLTSTADANGQVNYGYDASGRLTSLSGARAAMLAYSGEGSMTSIAQPAGTSTYDYNGLKQRVRKVTPQEGVVQFVYAENGYSLLGEYTSQGSALKEYVYLDGKPVLVLQGGNHYYVLPDHLDTPRAVKNPAGALMWTWDSDAFGSAMPNDNPSGISAFQLNLRFPGQYYDFETGWHYNWHRYYEPKTGRYTSSDPIGLAGGVNTYAYAGGSPVAYSDPTGLWLLFVVRLGLFAGSRLPQLNAIGIAISEAFAGVSIAGSASTVGAAALSNALRSGRAATPAALGSLKQLQSGTYRELTARGTVGDMLTPDHCPSYAAVRDAVESSVGRLTRAQRAQLRNELNSLVVPGDIHKLHSRTFGGRNSSSLRELDSLNLEDAFWRDIGSYKQAGVFSASELDAAADALHQLNLNAGVY